MQYDSGNQYNHTTAASWTSSNTGIAGVNTGLVNGVSAGSVSMDAFDANVPNYFHGCWGSNPDAYCPQSQGEQAGSTGTVGPYQVEPIYTASQGPANCTIKGQSGWVRNVTNQVQYVTGAAYAVSGLSVADNISVGATNQLGVSSKQEGHAPTTGDGSFQDTYYVCSAACPGSGQSLALQNWTVNGIPLFHVDGLVYKCGSITIDGH